MKTKILILCCLSVSILGAGCSHQQKPFLTEKVAEDASDQERRAAALETQLCAAQLQDMATQDSTRGLGGMVGAMPLLFFGLASPETASDGSPNALKGIFLSVSFLSILWSAWVAEEGWQNLRRASKYELAAVEFMQGKHDKYCSKNRELIHFGYKGAGPNFTPTKDMKGID